MGGGEELSSRLGSAVATQGLAMLIKQLLRASMRHQGRVRLQLSVIRVGAGGLKWLPSRPR